jgi:hypothetical protein
MKASLHFTLPDDRGEFDAALLGRKALSVLWEIDQRCREIVKYGEPSDDVRHLCEAIRSTIPAELLDV